MQIMALLNSFTVIRVTSLDLYPPPCTHFMFVSIKNFVNKTTVCPCVIASVSTVFSIRWEPTWAPQGQSHLSRSADPPVVT